MIDELAEANRRLEATMAENAGLHAQLLTQAREAGVLEERQRLAGEIHDTLAQGLTGIIAQLEAAEQRPDRPASGTGTSTRPGRWPARASPRPAARCRRCAPSQLEDARAARGDRATLARAGPRCRRRRSQVDDDRRRRVRCCAEIEAALFRVAQEALANVAQARQRHAGSRLTLSYIDDTRAARRRATTASASTRPTRREPEPAGTAWLGDAAAARPRVGGTLAIESRAGRRHGVSTPTVPPGVVAE